MNNEFDNKTKEYAIGRPSYPAEILKVMIELGVNNQSTIADIGAGTGILTHMLGSMECNVLAIEPNEHMLEECRKHCNELNNIQFIKAPAEKTSLKENSVDIITIAQAFHWFDKELCKKEFQRILKENGHVVILWNEMQNNSQFAKEYTTLLNKYKVKTTAAISNFDPDEEKLNFFGQDYTKVYYDNWQTVTEEGFTGGALSLSYTPSKLDNTYDEFVEELHQLFSEYQQNDKVTFHYKTEVCICKFSE
ncbi:class I SAM-dependent methyltransferase [Rossellomorea oryzaecorticis]|uniref:Class I SAM-dependent methyltransferase n=1 Tax=Rossellomorea oryzaecorticis TaxID=1396505 RepID=A0ABU9K511_9BACI